MTTSKSLQKSLLSWFAENQRDLPWRRTYDPYQIWISEIMLQQTQMDRVTIFFIRWMKEFPDLATLANSPEHKVLKCWEGLGYYSRARNIIKAAKLLITNHQGQIPDSRKLLLKLPGVGPYTAGAIASISFNRDVPVVDANIERILARLFNIDLIPNSPAARKLNWQKAEELLPSGEARNFNQALMELGALVCRPKQPNCSVCPVAAHCLALQYDLIPERPIPKKNTKTIPINMATGVLLHKGLIFIQQRLADDVWGALWEFPGGRMEEGETAEETVVREYLEETELVVRVDSKITTTIHHYTRYKVTLHCFLVSLEQSNSDPVLHAAQEFHWLPFEQVNQYAFPAGHRKLIQFMKAHKLP
ncbi:MAG: A/G-specific adenine glycosylase [Thermodesulfobacteriota bacterium]|nr:A/G-specific adenine glycosylase [Thermodesulfobacteriota bacterium]